MLAQNFSIIDSKLRHFLGYPIAVIPADPCVPTPCGPNSNCRQVGETAVCSCLPNYIGRSPNCRPECTTNSECSRSLACINERCVDPCVGSCGSFATCYVSNHRPICSCLEQYTGDPFSACSPIPSNSTSSFSPIDRSFLNALFMFSTCVASLSRTTRDLAALCTITVWCKCCVPRAKQCRLMQLPARIPWRSVRRMSPRMRHE